MSDTISTEEVRHVAQLSRLQLSDREVEHFTSQLGRVLDYVSKPNELNVEGVEPMAHALDLSNVLREDEARPGLGVDAALANAPDADSPFFKVPKVLGDGPGA